MPNKFIQLVLPLDICDGCNKIDPVIGSNRLFCDDELSFAEFYAGCENESFCKYIYERLKKKEESNNATK